MLAYFSFSAASTNSLPTISHSWIIACSLTAIYFAPALVAFFRRQQNRWFILALNFLFGWTIAGWIICLAWAARAPSGEPVVVVRAVPRVPTEPVRFFRRRFTYPLALSGPDVSPGIPYRADEVFPDRRPPSLKIALFRLVIAVISLAVVATVTISQWKASAPPPFSQPKHRIDRVPQIRNIDPDLPIPARTPPRRRYPSPAARSHEGYY
jgi:Superinfection immunity protein